MNILLVSANLVKSPFYVYPLGMSVCANILESIGCNVKQFDLLANNKSLNCYLNILLKFKPQLIGISLRNFDKQSISLVKILINVTKVYNIPIFVGGAGFSLYPYKILKEIGADYGLVGPAEDNLIKFINNFRKGIKNKKIIYANKHSNKICKPLYDKNIVQYYSKYPYSMNIYTKRGCKYNKCLGCIYMHIDGKNVRYRKINEIISDIKLLKNHCKVDNFFIADSTVNDDQEHLVKLLKQMKKEKLKIKWSAMLRVGNVSDKVIKLMKETKLDAPNIAIDASSDATLDGMSKGFSWQDVIDLDLLLNKYNIHDTRAFFMFGCPKETKETVLQGIENIKKLHFNTKVISIFKGFDQDSGYAYKKYIDSKVNISWLKKQLVKAFRNDKTIEKSSLLKDYI